MTSPPSDPDLNDSLDLVRQAQEGELVAYGELFARYYPRVRSLVRQRISPEVRKEMESGDVLQEAMMNAIRGFSGFEVRSRKELIGWFARIIENHLRTSLRQMHAQKRDRSLEVPLEFVTTYMEESAPNHRLAEGGPDPFELTARKEQQRILRESLEDLEPEQRRVIQLRHGERMSWAEVATELGRSGPDAARMLYARARIHLQRAVRSRGGDTQS